MDSHWLGSGQSLPTAMKPVHDGVQADEDEMAVALQCGEDDGLAAQLRLLTRTKTKEA